MATDKLFSPLALKNHTLKNRIGVAPMTRMSSESDSVPRQDVLDFLVRRAENGAAIVYTEAIVTENQSAARAFVAQVDAAAVMVNASTRFTDGGEFGFGAEIGISTQKLHARGPMGLTELTSTKYVVTGDGHIRT